MFLWFRRRRRPLRYAPPFVRRAISHLVSVGPSGEAVAVWTTDRPMATGDQRLESGQNQPEAMAGAVTVTDSLQARVVEFSGFAGSDPHAQPLPDGRVLLVEPWAVWRPEGPDLNASIYSADGELQLTACVGDGIDHLRTTAGGEIWMGYSDEGIYGNRGWDESGPSPIGACGLIRFSAELKPDWEFPGPTVTLEEHPELGISDCEALTIAGEAVWAYNYIDYPVVCINDQDLSSWTPAKENGPGCVRALISDGARVALAGAYASRDRGQVPGHAGRAPCWVKVGVAGLSRCGIVRGSGKSGGELAPRTDPTRARTSAVRPLISASPTISRTWPSGRRSRVSGANPQDA